LTLPISKLKRPCHICRKHEIEYKDYRFIDSCGLQGKTLVCRWCRDLDDVAISDIIRDDLDPEDFYFDPPPNCS